MRKHFVLPALLLALVFICPLSLAYEENEHSFATPKPEEIELPELITHTSAPTFVPVKTPLASPTASPIITPVPTMPPRITAAQAKAKSLPDNTFLLIPAAGMDFSTQAGNQKKTNSRDLAAPTINGHSGFLYAQTRAENTYLFSFLPEQDALLTLDFPGLSGVTAITVNDEDCMEGVPIPLGHETMVTVETRTQSMTVRIITTSLPILSLECDLELLEISDDTEDVNASLVIIDPAYATRGFTPYRFETPVRTSYRGNTARHYKAKRNFSVWLLDDEGEKRNMSLLGMRIDDGWIMDGMYNDILRMRNHVAFQLWGSFYEAPYNAKVTGEPNGAFTEVFVNGVYKGVYMFSERVDRKLLKLDKETGTLYRSTLKYVDGVNIAGFDYKRYQAPTELPTWYNMEIKYPNENITTQTWDNFYNLARLTITATDAEFKAEIQNYVDIDNLLDYFLFMNIIGATDNMDKNMFWASPDDSSTMLYLFPWDMDASLGRRYNAIRTVVMERYSGILFDRLLRLDIGGMNTNLRTRYAQLRSTVLNVPNIMSVINENYLYVERAGAWAREMAKHPTFTDHQNKGTTNVNPGHEMSIVEFYLTKHLIWLDERYDYQE